MKICKKFILFVFVSVFSLSATLGNGFMTEAPSQRTISSDSFPQAGKFYTLVGKEIDWTLVDGENTTMPIDIMLKSSVQDVVDNVAIVNRSTGWVAMSPENMVGTVDANYEIDLNRTILWGHRNRMIFTPAGFQGLDNWPLDMDVGEHTWVWYPTDLYIGAEVLVGWTFDSEFLGDTLYEVVRDEVVQVVGEKQDCWVLRFPPSLGLDGWVWAETLRVDKETGVPLKVNGEGRALDGSSGLEYELVLTRTNIDLGTESTQPPSPTYTLTVPSTPGFPEAGKFWSWYVLEKGWNMRGALNVSYYQEGLLTRWVANVTDDEALVYKIFWGDYLCDGEGVKELEAVDILYTIYRVNTTTREIIEAISSLIYHINMTSLTYEIIDHTALLADDVGEETYCWLPTNIHIGAKVNITWSYDRSWTLDNATDTVIDEKILSALEKPQACWVLYLPPTASIDGTWNYSDTWDSDKDTGIPLCSFSKGWAVDDSSAWVDNCWFMDTNVDLGPSTYYLTITSAAAGTTNPLPGTYNYTEGSSLNVTAIPNPGYSFDYWLLDGKERTENPITIVIDANHTLEAVYFAVDITPPNITNVSQNPPKNNVLPEDEVKINATVTDALSEVKRVTLIYSYANTSGMWIRVVNMTNLEGNVWNATIPAFPYGTSITYIIMAEDKAGNTITTIEMGYEYQYPVIPEFPTAIVLLLFIAATIVTIILGKTNIRRKPQEKNEKRRKMGQRPTTSFF